MPGPRPIAVVWDPRFRSYEFGPEHPFTERSRDLAARLLRASLAPAEAGRVRWVGEVEPSPPESLTLFHEATYVAAIEAAGAAVERTWLDAGDTPSFPGCYDAARTIVGGMEAAVGLALEERIRSFHPAGGLHHAAPGAASGFCIFNDLGVGIARAVAAGFRVAYVDLDVHHGDGVMYGFYDSGRVLAIDFHEDGRGQFPGTGFPEETGRGDGAGSKVNVPLPPGAGDEAFLPLFRRIVPPLFEAFRPQLVVVQHGVDAHWGDALGRLQYTSRGYREALRTLAGLADEHAHGRLVVTGGGGYRAGAVARILAGAGRLLAGLPLPSAATPTPKLWRAEFEQEMEAPAPTRWDDAPVLPPSPWNREREEALVRALEAALGRRFPAPAGSPHRARGERRRASRE